MTPDLRARCEAFLADPEHEFEQHGYFGKGSPHPYRFQVDALEAFAREIRRETLEEVRQYYESVFNRQFTLVTGDAVAFKRWLDAQLNAEKVVKNDV